MEERLSPHFPNAFYRVSVKGIYVRDEKVLLVHDFANPDRATLGKWELPGGGLDFGESFAPALIREIKEETGLTVTWVQEKPTYIWSVKHGPGRGMEWYWVLMPVFRFEIEDIEAFVPTDECREMKFFSAEELRENIDSLSEQTRPLVEHFDPKDFS